MKPSLKDLRTAQRVLQIIDYPVADELLLYLSNRIMEIEQSVKQRRMERMTDEDLLAFDEKKHYRLRVHLKDGSFIQMKHNKQTFEQAIRLIDFNAAPHYDIRVGTKRLFHVDPTQKQKRVKRYLFVNPGLFVLTGTTVSRQKEILEALDEFLELGWEIELI